MKKHFQMVFGLALLVFATSSQAHADEGRFKNGITQKQWEQARRYEMFRRQKVDNAKTVEEFLDYATPEEIQQEFGIEDEEISDLVWNAADGDPDLKIVVNLRTQKISVTSPSGLVIDNAPIASGRPGYRTEAIAREACYRPRALERMHWSKKFNAPMPWSVFIVGGYALHQGSLSIRSHGCVHLSASVAKTIFQLVQQYGRSNTCILIRK